MSILGGVCCRGGLWVRRDLVRDGGVDEVEVLYELCGGQLDAVFDG